MALRSPIRDGFAAITRQPVVFLAEIAWRWTFGLAALLMAAFGALQYLHSLTVTDSDKAALESGVPALMGQAVAHILQGSGERLVYIVIVVSLALGASWTLLAAIGRAATLRALLRQTTSQVRPLLGLSFLRAALALAAGVATFGAMIVASLAATQGPENRPEVFIFVFLGLAALITFIYSVLNWYLSLAPVFAVRDGRDGLAAVAGAFAAVRRHRAEFTRVGLAFGGVRLFVIAAFTVLSLIPLAMVTTAPPALVWTVFVLLALTYFAISDFLYLARLAAYIEIVRPEPEPAAMAPSHGVEPAIPPVQPVAEVGDAGL